MARTQLSKNIVLCFLWEKGLSKSCTVKAYMYILDITLVNGQDMDNVTCLLCGNCPKIVNREDFKKHKLFLYRL